MGKANRKAAAGAQPRISGQLPTQVANGIMAVMCEATAGGMEADAASCVAVQVVAEFAALHYGPEYAIALGGVIRQRIQGRDHADIVRQFERDMRGQSS